MNRYLFLMVGAAFVAAVSQILLKISAGKKEQKGIFE